MRLCRQFGDRFLPSQFVYHGLRLRVAGYDAVDRLMTAQLRVELTAQRVAINLCIGLQRNVAGYFNKLRFWRQPIEDRFHRRQLGADELPGLA